ncbi:MAG TPA: hypothetical protein VGI63_08835 [Verrucomicrobiae bacterium]|jgi:hypothetical protein
MIVKINFGKPDVFLASAIRGIANQVEGFQTVKGQSNFLMMLLDSLEFVFSGKEQAERFEKAVRKYIASEILEDVQIEFVSS